MPVEKGIIALNSDWARKGCDGMGRKKKKKEVRWLRLDNAAKIYPAARSQNWSSVFRLSATLSEPVDAKIMQSALDAIVPRFPSIVAGVRRGIFWYYLQQVESAPKIRRELSYPLARMSRKEASKCALRVIVYRNRVAVEFFHSLTDGTGALVFVKSLLAEYLQRRYGLEIAATDGVLSRQEEPSPEELEDSFQRYAGPVKQKPKEKNAWRLWGTPEKDGFLNLTCFEMDSDAVKEKAHEYGVSVTVYLCAALMDALQQLQKHHIKRQHRRKPLKVQIPVNLRRMFPSSTLRNFALYTSPQIEPRTGGYSFEEICRLVQYWIGLEITPRKMASMIASNVGTERVFAVKILPLFIKNFVMKAAFIMQGERKYCLSMSNLGDVSLPPEMRPYVQRMDFVLGAQATAPYNCGVITLNHKLYMNFIRNTREAQLERAFFEVLRQQGLAVQLSSNNGL